MVPYFQPESIPIFGDFSVKPFGLMAAMATVTFYFRSVWGAGRLGLDKKKMEGMCFSIVITALLTAHLFELVAYRPGQLWENPGLVFDFGSGFSSFGGFLGTFLGGVIYCRFIGKMPILPYADCIARYFPIAWALGRVGCFLIHDHPGIESDSFLAVEFPNGPRYDLGFLEMVYVLGLEGLFFVLRRKERPVGFFMGLLIALYAPVRFVLEFLRLPEGTILDGLVVGDRRYLGLTPAQYGCFIFLTVGIYLMVRYRHLRWEEFRVEESEEAAGAEM